MSRITPVRLVPPAEPVLVGDFLREWLDGKRSLRPSTAVSYAGHINRYLVPLLGQIPLIDLSHREVDLAYRTISKADPELATSTLHRIHATFMSALNTAVRTGQIDRNPAETVELPQLTRCSVRTWSPAEFSEFLTFNADDDLVLAFRLMGLLGLRRGEVLALTWSAFDDRTNELRIERSLGRIGSAIVLGQPKSAAGRRVLAVDAGTADELRSHRAASRRGSATYVQSDWIFVGEGGLPVDPAYLSRHFDRMIRNAALPRIRLHDLRHTSASIGLAAGESLVEISRRLGHSSITITADIYSHISPALSHSAAERLARQVLPASD